MKFLKKMFKRDPDKVSVKKADKAVKILSKDGLAQNLVYDRLEDILSLRQTPSAFVGTSIAVAASAPLFAEDFSVDDLIDEPGEDVEWVEAMPLDDAPDPPPLTIGDMTEQQVQGSVHNDRR